jgi:hypothetical protein
VGYMVSAQAGDTKNKTAAAIAMNNLGNMASIRSDDADHAESMP